MFELASNILPVLIQLFSLWFLYYQITKSRLKMWGIVISFALFYASAVILGTYWAILLIPFYYIYSLCTEDGIDKSLALFYAVYTSFVFLLLNNIVNLLIYVLVPINVWDSLRVVSATLSIVVVSFGHLLIVKVFKIDFQILKRKESFVIKKMLLPINRLLVSGYVVFMGFYFYEMRTESVNEYTKYIFFIYIFMFFSMIAFLSTQSKNYLQQQIQRVKEDQYEQLELYTREIEELYQKIRGFRHDYGNMLISLKESIDSNDISEISKVYEEILLTANIQLKGNHYNIAELSNIGDSAVKSIFSSKLMLAEQKGIQVNVEVKEEINNLNMSVLDFIRVLSILLDNAIEASTESDCPKLDIAMLKEEDNFILIIKNSKSIEKVPVSKIFDPDFSTKGPDRGMGLFNVQTIVGKHDNITIDTTSEEEYFIQTICVRGEN